MDEKETLIRVEQQLQDSIKNQSLILSDLKEIFNKIEAESKAISSVKADLNTHLEMTPVRREETERRFKVLDEKLKEISTTFNEFQNDISDERKKHVDEINETKVFQKQITTSIGLIKWLIGIMFIAISALWPIFLFLNK